jgi:hypothetical protein
VPVKVVVAPVVPDDVDGDEVAGDVVDDDAGDPGELVLVPATDPAATGTPPAPPMAPDDL